MKNLSAIVVVTLAFAAPLFAQQSSYSCDDQRIGGADYRVCEFDGKFAVDLEEGTYHWSATFDTSSQFRAWKRKQETRYADKHTNHKSEAEAQSWHTEDYCTADGFKWHHNGCHVK
jgi:hypothetical protein